MSDTLVEYTRENLPKALQREGLWIYGICVSIITVGHPFIALMIVSTWLMNWMYPTPEFIHPFFVLLNRLMYGWSPIGLPIALVTISPIFLPVLSFLSWRNTRRSLDYLQERWPEGANKSLFASWTGWSISDQKTSIIILLGFIIIIFALGTLFYGAIPTLMAAHIIIPFPFCIMFVLLLQHYYQTPSSRQSFQDGYSEV